MWSWYAKWSQMNTHTPPIRCLDEEKLFPASKPVLCEEKNANPFFEIKCCRSGDYCNKFIRFDPKRGEIQHRSSLYKTNHTNPCANWPTLAIESSTKFVFWFLNHFYLKCQQIIHRNHRPIRTFVCLAQKYSHLVLKLNIFCIRTINVFVHLNLNLHVGKLFASIGFSPIHFGVIWIVWRKRNHKSSILFCMIINVCVSMLSVQRR